MSFFTPAQLVLLSKGTVRIATLVEFQFEPVLRLWNGDRTLKAGGHDWLGLGLMGKIEGLAENRSAEAVEVKFTLSGTSADINLQAISEAEEQAGRLAIVYFQLFDDSWATIGNPIVVWTGITQPMSASSVAGAEGEGRQRSITLPAENLFFGRSRPAAGLYTDRDQQARYAGDLFFQYQALMKNFTYVWP